MSPSHPHDSPHSRSTDDARTGGGQTGDAAADSLDPAADAGGWDWRRWTLPTIMLAVLAWGLFHAGGAYWNYRYAGAEYRNVLRAVVIVGCVLGFLGFWQLMLWSRSRRNDRGR